MTSYELGDAPLSEPEQDLLQMAPHAKTLAGFLDHVQLPFTLGIYGAWGEGKTTFSHLLWRYLSERPAWKKSHLIEFSAWPYVTADAIWRALLDMIARHICGQSPEPVELHSEAPARSLYERIQSFLQTNVVTLRADPVDANRDRYERLRRRFDHSAALANRTIGDPAVGANLSALAGLVLDAAATVSPGVGPLRRLLGTGESSVRALLTGEQATAPQVVTSVEEMRSDLRDLFRESAGSDPEKLVILLDDLDRCLPQVALDFLETIKVFFFESAGVNAPCLFLLAVDEELVGRAIRMRTGSETDIDADEEARMYLEKIVQLRVPVPNPDDRQIHRLVSAGFPEWTLTTDIIGAGIGRNPRRIKQQCNLMSYGFQAREARDNARG
jgi:hypothetical protein